jgi:hypothetical protein
MRLCVAITLHQQTKNQIIFLLKYFSETNMQKKGHEKNNSNIFLSHAPCMAVGGGVEPPTMQLAKEQNLVVNPSRN